eukprot:08802.XXX_14729_15412_1 [CDS] Oithona nana genome sequencing.
MTIQKFLKSALAWHHILIFTVALPVILVFRRGLGDLFVGLLYTMEASVPFVAIRAILQTTGKGSSVATGQLDDNYNQICKNRISILYLINLIILTLVYFLVRIAVWPLIYWLYAYQRQLRMVEAVFALPLHCHLGTMAIFLFQAHWFIRICKTTVKAYREYHSTTKLMKKKS